MKVEPKYIDQAWKLTLWVYGIDGVLRLPLRFVKSALTPDTIRIFSIVRFIIFIAAVFLAGILYVQSTKKGVDKGLKLRVAAYIAIITLVWWILLTIILGDVFAGIFGGFIEGMLSVILTFVAVYIILPLGEKVQSKQTV